MWPLRIREDARRSATASSAIAAATLVIWFALYNRLQPQTFFDESSHLGAILAIARGDYQLHPELPMFPGYHWVVYLVSLPFGASLTAARLATLGFALAGVALYTAIRRGRYGADPYAPVRFAWLPLLFPFTAMAYTDVPSVVLVLGAVWALSRGRPVESALWLALACAVRQTNVVWALFLAGWVALDSWPALGVIARRAAGYAVVFAGCALVFAALGRVQARPVEGQEVTFNLNHLFVLAPLALVLWLPVWLARIPNEVRWLRLVFSRRPARAGLVLAVLAVASAWLLSGYRIVHQGNAYTGYFLRNEPLLWMRDSIPLRALGVLLVILAGYLLARLVWTQPERQRLALAAGVGALYITPHGLVDPRYYLVPAVLFGVFVQLPDIVERRLVIWQGALCVLLIVIIANDWLW